MKLSREKRSHRAKKGSQFHLQNLVNKNPDLLNEQILEASGTLKDQISGAIKWVSPLAKENYLEYQDEKFLEAIGCSQLKVKLSEFWPKGGPVWDALATIPDRGTYFLCEAKANIPELISETNAKAEQSIKLIQKSLESTQNFLKSKPLINWTKGFYQYANRIAHLYYLRALNKAEAYLVFIYFCNDYTHIPTSRKEWEGAQILLKTLLGLKQNKFQEYTIDLYVDVSDIERNNM